MIIRGVLEVGEASVSPSSFLRRRAHPARYKSAPWNTESRGNRQGSGTETGVSVRTSAGVATFGEVISMIVGRRSISVVLARAVQSATRLPHQEAADLYFALFYSPPSSGTVEECT